MLQFTVVDTGIGIDGEHAEHLFEAFTQEDGSASRRKGGTGLGLAICKSLVEMMGGEIWAGGEIDQGSTFGFRIAFETASASPERIAPEPLDEQEIGARLKGVRILLVEDEIMNQIVTRELLENAGIVVDTADNGREAVEAAKGVRYDAILMDLDIPGWDGLEATRRIRSWETGIRQSETDPVPIIAITAHAMKGDREQCLDVGMDDYLSKPLDSGQLFRTLNRWAGREFRPDSNRTMKKLTGAAGVDSGEVKEKDLPSPSKITPLLHELSGLLKENNLKTDDCLSRIKECLINTRLHETMVQLELQVISIDYQRAGITLDRIADVFSFSLKEI